LSDLQRMRGTRNTGASECRTGIRRSLKPRQRRCRQQISPNPRIAPSLSPPLTHAPPDFEPCQQPPAERCRQNRAAEPNCKTHGASRSRSVEPCQSPRRLVRRSPRRSVLAVSFTGPTNPLPMAWLANQAARPPTGAASIARQARPVTRGMTVAQCPGWPSPIRASGAGGRSRLPPSAVIVAGPVGHWGDNRKHSLVVSFSQLDPQRSRVC
jgi:hypothetical protein